jgi:UDP-glucose 4-epimerase
MRVLVTGAAGHLGSALLPVLLSETRIASVIAFDLVAPRLRHPKLRILIGDVLGPALAQAFEGVDAVIHLAFVVPSAERGPQRKDRALIRAINLGGTRRVAARAAAAGVSRLIYTSSVAVYGAWPDNPLLIDEDRPLRPNPGFSYGEDKAAVEDWLDGFTASGPSLAVTRLRLAAIVGPNALPLVNALARSRIYPSVPDPQPAVQCLWEGDAVAAILAAFEGSAGVYNIAAPGARPYRDLVRLDSRLAVGLPFSPMERLHGLVSHFSSRWGDKGWLAGLKYPLVVTTARAESALDWRARLSVEECVRHMRRGRRAQDRSSP